MIIYKKAIIPMGIAEMTPVLMNAYWYGEYPTRQERAYLNTRSYPRSSRAELADVFRNSENWDYRDPSSWILVWWWWSSPS